MFGVALLPFKGIMVLTNMSILCFLVTVIWDHFKASNSLKSWSSGFYILSFCWLVMRGFFWMYTIVDEYTWHAFAFYTFYWGSVPFQFSSFMIVPLYYANILYPREWHAYRNRVITLYSFVTALSTAFMILWGLLVAIEKRKQYECFGEYQNRVDDAYVDRCFRTEFSSIAFRVVAAVLFLFLALVQSTYTAKLITNLEWHQRGLFQNDVTWIHAVNILLSVAFATHGLYQAVAIFIEPQLQSVNLESTKDISALTFIAFVFWDYLPVTLLMLTLRTGPSRHESRAPSRGSSFSSESDTLALLGPMRFYGSMDGKSQHRYGPLQQGSDYSRKSGTSRASTESDGHSRHLDRFAAPELTSGPARTWLSGTVNVFDDLHRYSRGGATPDSSLASHSTGMDDYYQHHRKGILFDHLDETGALRGGNMGLSRASVVSTAADIYGLPRDRSYSNRSSASGSYTMRRMQQYRTASEDNELAPPPPPLLHLPSTSSSFNSLPGGVVDVMSSDHFNESTYAAVRHSKPPIDTNNTSMDHRIRLSPP